MTYKYIIYSSVWRFSDARGNCFIWMHGQGQPLDSNGSNGCLAILFCIGSQPTIKMSVHSLSRITAPTPTLCMILCLYHKAGGVGTYESITGAGRPERRNATPGNVTIHNVQTCRMEC